MRSYFSPRLQVRDVVAFVAGNRLQHLFGRCCRFFCSGLPKCDRFVIVLPGTVPLMEFHIAKDAELGNPV